MSAENEDQELAKKTAFSKKVWITGGIISFIIVSLLLLKTLISILLLTLAGVLVAIYFHAFAGIFIKFLHLSPRLSLILSVLINVLLLVGFFWFVGARLQQQIAELSETLPTTIEHAKSKLGETTVGRKVLQYLNETGDNAKSRAVVNKFFSSSFGVISDLYIIILLSLFFTVSPTLYKKGIVSLLPSPAKEQGAALLERLGEVLKKWLEGQIIGFFFIAILTGVGLFILGMPLVLTLALIAGLFNFIPNFGPIIALIPAVLLALMQDGTTAVIVAVMYTSIQIVQSAVTQPLIQQKMVNIPPALMIFGQVALGLVAGFWGVLLAVPLVAIIMTVVNELYVKKQKHPSFS